MTTASDTINTRAKTHGDYASKACFIQAVKGMLRAQEGWHSLGADQRESLDLICTKIGRILFGDCTEPDHWLDIEGYAKLARNRL